MKNKITQLLRFGLTMFAIGFLFTNCENEETQEEIISVENEIPSLTIKNYSKEKIEENTKLISRLKEINNNLIENKSAKESGKIIYNKEYDFTIDTDSAKYIENETYHSYTFPTVQGVDEKITNILFELNEHNEYDAFLVKYDYTSDELKQENLESLSMKTSMEPIDFDFESLSNKMKSNWVCVYSYEKIKHEGVISGHNGGNVGGTRITYEWVLLASHCEIVTNYIGSNETYGSNTATITNSGSMTTSGSGGGSFTSPTPPSTPYEGEDLIKLNLVKDKLKLNLPQKSWIDKNGQFAFEAHDILSKNMFSSEAVEFAKSAMYLEMTLSKDTQIVSTNKLPSELDSCCPGNCCPDIRLYMNDRIVHEYGIQPVLSLIDGSFNLLVGTSELIGTDKWIGSRIRKMMIEIGIDVPTDIDDEHLSQLFRVRKRDNILIVEYRPGLLKSMLDAGLDTLNVLAFLSPAKGGGPVLFAKFGGSLSITSLSNHIRDITVSSVKIDNVIENLKSNAKYVLEGTGEYKNVGGHHPLAKIAFKSDKFYDLQKAFSVSISKLDEIKIGIHSKITGQQNSLYSTFSKSGQVLTIEKMADIEIQAMVNAGVPRDIATGWVLKALEDLKEQGVKVITNVPWNGLN